MTMFRVLVAVAVAAAVTGCVSSGVRVDESKLSQFERGKSTYGEVVSALGTPTTTSLTSDGRRIIIYAYVQSQARPESFIPFIGPLVGGADSRASNVSFAFDQKGVLQSYASTQSQHGLGTGFASGASPADRDSAQPRRAE